MADVESVIGARIRITTKEGSYEGTVHSLDQRNRKLTLTKGNKTKIHCRFSEKDSH